MAAAARNNERFAEAELYRLKGELLLDCGLRIADWKKRMRHRICNPGVPARNPQSEVEDCFHRAIEIARRREAKSRELRAATSPA